MILYFLDLFVSCQNVICLISFKIRLDPFALISLWIHSAGWQLFDLALVWSHQNLSASADRTCRERVWTAYNSSNSKCPRKLWPSIQSFHQALGSSLLWCPLTLKFTEMHVLSAHAPKIVPYEVRLMSTYKQTWAPRHSLKHWSFSTGGLKLHKHSVFQKDRGISSSCAIAVSRNLGANCRRWFEPNRSKQCKVPLLERSLAKHYICFFIPVRWL